MIELYRTTGDRRYLDFAGYLLSGTESRRLKLTDEQVKYMFRGIPFASRTQLEGHAVRALYACSGAADYYLETGEAAYRETLERLWRDLVDHKMYLTGGVGSRAQGESFGDNYELPNAQAYSESCAAIANVMWNWRMLAATGEAHFADVMERALYNGVNSGMSLSGTLYCYRNPLESGGGEVRNPWYEVTCCPPNLERTFAALPGYLYGTSAAGVYVHLYHESTLDWHLENGSGLKLTQQTDYPWDGNVSIKVMPVLPSEFTVYARVPGWSKTTTVTVNGKAIGGTPKAGEYFPVWRRWNLGDTLGLVFDMRPRVIMANPRVREDAGRVAVERGPLVYCLEQRDQRGVESLFDVSLALAREPTQGFTSEFQENLLGGVVVLRHKGIATMQPQSDEPLYRSFVPVKEDVGREVELTFIPYYAWSNRGPSAMQVWTPYIMLAQKQ
jgi:uncharacterized protein